MTMINVVLLTVLVAMASERMRLTENHGDGDAYGAYLGSEQNDDDGHGGGCSDDGYAGGGCTRDTDDDGDRSVLMPLGREARTVIMKMLGLVMQMTGPILVARLMVYVLPMVMLMILSSAMVMRTMWMATMLTWMLIMMELKTLEVMMVIMTMAEAVMIAMTMAVDVEMMVVMVSGPRCGCGWRC